MNSIKWGVALEGGGARGAYQIGAYEVLLERGYDVHTIVGTSIGCINAAIIAQGNFEDARKIWEEIKYNTIFDVDEKRLKAAMKKDINLDIVKYLSKRLTSVIKSGGIDTIKMRKLFENYIDEEKLRNSDTKFGLATYCITDRKPVELFIEDIPKGQVIDFMLASSRLPIFKQESLNGKYYVDGGVYNNCPVNMLQELGIKNIIQIKTNSIGYTKAVKHANEYNMITIAPKNPLPNIMSFDNEASKYMIRLGKYDALKVLDDLDGFDYYIENYDEEYYFRLLSNYDLKKLHKVYVSLKLSNTISRKVFFETVIPSIMKKIGMKETKTYKEVVIALTEYVAKKEDIEMFNVYKFEELLQIVKSKASAAKANKVDEVIYKFIKGL